VGCPNGCGGRDVPENVVPRAQTIEFAPDSRPHRLSTPEHGVSPISDGQFHRRNTVDTLNDDRSKSKSRFRSWRLISDQGLAPFACHRVDLVPYAPIIRCIDLAANLVVFRGRMNSLVALLVDGFPV
jgi:hypothetical protein